jgi:hypothetical protein
LLLMVTWMFCQVSQKMATQSRKSIFCGDTPSRCWARSMARTLAMA